MSVYQDIKDRFIMKNAWEDWRAYRSELTDTVLGLDPESVMIIGAGPCNDIDLRRISENVEKVILADIDEESMKMAVTELPEDLRCKIMCKTVSFTGIKEYDIEKFCNRMLILARAKGQNLTLEYVREQIILNIQILKESMIQNETELIGCIPENSADLVVCCGVHSQLFSTLSFFLRSYINSLSDLTVDVELLESDIKDIIGSMNDQVIPIINNILLNAAGRIIIFGNEYNVSSPVEGALQCMTDVREKLHPVEKNLLWPFNPEMGISYDMLLQICDKER